jgi:hypothetical protein
MYNKLDLGENTKIMYNVQDMLSLLETI